MFNTSGNSSSNTVSNILGMRSYKVSNHLEEHVKRVKTEMQTASSNCRRINFTNIFVKPLHYKTIPHPSTSSGGVDYYNVEIAQATDYAPFGCELKGRNLKKSGVNKSFRFGFQGQEGDDEIKGDGNSVNYKYRMHDPRLGRFFAVDPLVFKYPYNSPYIFCENRVIDGVDFEGSEYITYLVLLNTEGTSENIGTIDHTSSMTDADILRVHGVTAVEFYKTYSASFEAKGQGVLYEYYYKDEKGELIEMGEYMENKTNLTSFGIYAGSGCTTYCGGNDKDNPYVSDAQNDDYDFEKTPIDEVDAAAKQHDYDQSVIPDNKGHFKDIRNLPSDRKFIKTLEAYKERSKDPNYKDLITGRRPSKEALDNVDKALNYFKAIETPVKEIKQARIDIINLRDKVKKGGKTK